MNSEKTVAVMPNGTINLKVLELTGLIAALESRNAGLKKHVDMVGGYIFPERGFPDTPKAPNLEQAIEYAVVRLKDEIEVYSSLLLRLQELING